MQEIRTKDKSELTEQEQQERLWGMFCHLSALAGFLGIPFGSILGPLIIWLIKRNDYSFVDEQGKESLNFQISMTIYGIVSALLILVVVGIFLLIALVVFELVMIIIASVKASNGEYFRYPLTIRIIK